MNVYQITLFGLFPKTEAEVDAILTAARAYRKLHGRLPSGVKVEIKQEL